MRNPIGEKASHIAVIAAMLGFSIGYMSSPVFSRTNPACDRVLNKGKDADAAYVKSMMRCHSLFPEDEQYANALATWYIYQNKYSDSLHWANKAVQIGDSNNAKYNGSESYYLGVSWLIKMFSEYALAKSSEGSWSDVKISSIAASQLAGCSPKGEHATNYVVDKDLSKEEREAHCSEALLAFVNAQYYLGDREKACANASLMLKGGMGSYKGMFDYDLSGIVARCSRKASKK